MEEELFEGVHAVGFSPNKTVALWETIKTVNNKLAGKFGINLDV